MTPKAKAARILKQLGALYPNPPIPLDHTDPYTLLVAVMLSAQTTDKKVNEVTPALFKDARTPAAMAKLPVEKILSHIRQVGLAPTKAKNLKRMAELLLERHGGKVPASMEALEDLPGVGHKTASVVMSQAFGVPAFPVDTHIHRLATRWGLTSGKNVETTEADLKAVFPEDTWNAVHLQIIYFGRGHCPAKAHDMNECPVCSWAAPPEARALSAVFGTKAKEAKAAAKAAPSAAKIAGKKPSKPKGAAKAVTAPNKRKR